MGSSGSEESKTYALRQQKLRKVAHLKQVQSDLNTIKQELARLRQDLGKEEETISQRKNYHSHLKKVTSLCRGCISKTNKKTMMLREHHQMLQKMVSNESKLFTRFGLTQTCFYLRLLKDLAQTARMSMLRYTCRISTRWLLTNQPTNQLTLCFFRKL